MQAAPRPPPGGQSQIVCGGCRTLLMFPQGAQNVRCARCAHITPVPPPVTQETMAQLHCTSCRTLLMYPRGALQVQCSLCGVLNDAQQANQLGHVVCGGCQITLMYAYGAQSVKCAVCNHVTPVAQRPGGPPGHPPPHQQPYPRPAPAQQQPTQQHRLQLAADSSGAHVEAVLVENPPSLDESGNEVQNVAIGTKPKDAS